jgi:hypothetical protein
MRRLKSKGINIKGDTEGKKRRRERVMVVES